MIQGFLVRWLDITSHLDLGPKAQARDFSTLSEQPVFLHALTAAFNQHAIFLMYKSYHRHSTLARTKAKLIQNVTTKASRDQKAQEAHPTGECLHLVPEFP